MADVKAVVCTVGIGGWYPRGVARLIESMHKTNHGIEVCAWVNTYPNNSPQMVVDGYDYSAYVAKPAALRECLRGDADVVILCDAAFYAIRHLRPLINHIYDEGYYACNNGNVVGNWASDKALAALSVTRDQAMEIREVSSYCVGIARHRAMMLADQWAGMARISDIIAGPHTNSAHGWTGRNAGWCSSDPRCYGHRHDQTLLSVLMWRAGMMKLVDRPRFTAYQGSETAETVLVNQGGL